MDFLIFEEVLGVSCHMQRCIVLLEDELRREFYFHIIKEGFAQHITVSR
jgi:hypothetical protein